MLKKPHYIILVLVILLVAILATLHGNTMGRVKLAVSGLFLPLFGLTGSAHDTLNHTADSLVSKADIQRENARLRQENDELKFRLVQETAVWNENVRLRNLANWPQQHGWKARLARVIARDPANWWRSVQIDLGKRDGLQTNLAVLTTDGLVGRVQSVGQGRSQVILLGDPELKVAAIVSNHETGVINSSSAAPLDNDMVELDYLAGSTGARPGMTVETWGEGGVFPAHIPIGKIVDVRAREFGLTSEARVKLDVNLDALEEVYVLMP